MFKKEIGISVYPMHTSVEQSCAYIKKAHDYGYTKLFTSLFYLEGKQFNTNIKKYQEVLSYAKKLGFYIIVDIGPEVVKAFNDDYHFTNIRKLGIDCLRLDTPLLAQQVAQITHYGVDIQINASYLSHFINDVLDFKPVVERISVMHNFYPKHHTGLDINFFNECNSRFYSLGLNIGAFVTSQTAPYGQQLRKIDSLPTIESHRDLPIATQAKQILASGKVSTIIIGNFPASDAELKSLANVNFEKIILDIKTTKTISVAEEKILLHPEHFRRGDLTHGFIRSTTTRNSQTINVKPSNAKNKFQKGDVIILNNNDLHYQGEV
jgi:hypothetical protein